MRRWIVVLLIGLLPLAGVGWMALSRDGATARDASPAAPAARPAPAAQPGERLTADLRAQLAGLEHLRGVALAPGALEGRVVLVTFFASWCPPCRTELAHLKELRAALHPDGLEVVAVNLFEDFDGLSDRRRLNAYLDILRPEFPVVAGNDAVSRAFGDIRRIPTLLVFDREGRRALRFVNARGAEQTAMDAAELRAAIAPLL